MANKRATIDEVREQCEARLFDFARLMFPNRTYGEVHKDLFDYFQFGEARNKLALIPRDHQKSHCLAVYCAWRLTVDPWWTILYVSSNHDLAIMQLSVIKDILSSDTHRAVWPQMLNYENNQYGQLVHKPLKNNVWTQHQIMVDHPVRFERKVRDPSISVTSVKSSKTGFHAKEIVFDDLVTDENYSSQILREEVVRCYSNLAKIATTGSLMKGVGTRYADNDLYGVLVEATYPLYKDGLVVENVNLWETFQKVVEDSQHRDGTGQYLWPKEWNEHDQCYYGFDQQELAIKKAQLTIDNDLRQLELWFGQYYNDPNDSSLEKLNRNTFIYYEPKKLISENGNWYFNNKRLKLFAAADLAFTESKAWNAKRRDYTAVAVIGVDEDGYIYVLSLDRFQTEKMEVYYDHIIGLHDYWGFREITIEANNGGSIVKAYLEDEVRRNGGNLVVQGKSHTSHQGTKKERIEQTLMPRYRARTIYHKKDGISKQLEEELILPKPSHDDLKDVLAFCVSISKPPLKRGSRSSKKKTNVLPMSRFGGVRRRG